MTKKKSVNTDSVFVVNDFVSIQSLKDLYINHVMRNVGFSIQKAAVILGISDRTIYNRIYAGKINYDYEKKHVQSTKRDG